MRNTENRGSILVMSIFFMVILFIAASAFLVLLPVESRAVLRTEQQTQGSLVADAGVSEAIAWLRFQLAPPDGSGSREPMQSSVYPSAANRTRSLGNGWSYRWSLIADGETFPNGSNPIRAFTVVSRAYRNGVVAREARAEIIQESLARYAALYDGWPTDLVMGISSDSEPAGGPVHVNDVLNLWNKDGASFWTSPGAPKFSHGLTSSKSFAGSQDGFGWYQGNYSGSSADMKPYNAGGPIASRYNRLANGGRDDMKSGQSKIPLPANTFQIKSAAWGFNPVNPLPTVPGVYLNEEAGALGGVYIQGAAEEVELGVGGNQPAGPLAGQTGPNPPLVNFGDNSWVKIELPIAGQNSIDTNRNVTVVSVESPVTLPVGSIVNGIALTSSMTYPAGTTLLRRADGRFESHNSRLNGVVYSTGDIRNLWGVNKGKRTIAAESDSGTNTFRDIFIGGRENDSNSNPATNLSLAPGQKGLIQFGAVDADGDGVLDPPATGEHTLGIVARNVMITERLKQNSSWANSHPKANPLYIFAVVLGGIDGGGGTYAVQATNGWSGGAGWAYKYGSRIMANGGAWGSTSGHGLVEGNTFYDKEAAQSPPPYFPSSPSFVVKAYLDVPVTDGETI